MSRRVLVILASLIFAVPAMALPADVFLPSNAAQATGKISLRIDWKGAVPLPAGALVVCRARATPFAPSDADEQAREASGVAPGDGGQCALEIPLAWRGGAVPVTVTVAYELDIALPSGTVVWRSGAFQTGANALVQLSIQR